MELREALSQIADIRMQMTRTRMFRGYRAATTLGTALAAAAAAAWQARTIDAAAEPWRFVQLWIAVAVFSLVLVGTEMAYRYRRSDSSLDRQLTRDAIKQFAPFLIMGGLATSILCTSAYSGIWVLPALWQMLFGLGIYCSRRLLPPAVAWVGVFYMGCAGINLWHATDWRAFSPWAMALPFVAGQTAAAVILHWALERNHEK